MKRASTQTVKTPRHKGVGPLSLVVAGRARVEAKKRDTNTGAGHPDVARPSAVLQVMTDLTLKAAKTSGAYVPVGCN